MKKIILMISLLMICFLNNKIYGKVEKQVIINNFMDLLKFEPPETNNELIAVGYLKAIESFYPDLKDNKYLTIIIRFDADDIVKKIKVNDIVYEEWECVNYFDCDTYLYKENRYSALFIPSFKFRKEVTINSVFTGDVDLSHTEIRVNKFFQFKEDENKILLNYKEVIIDPKLDDTIIKDKINNDVIYAFIGLIVAIIFYKVGGAFIKKICD